MDHDLITSNDEIGHCVIGAQSEFSNFKFYSIFFKFKASEVGAKHWKDMLALQIQITPYRRGINYRLNGSVCSEIQI